MAVTRARRGEATEDNEYARPRYAPTSRSSAPGSPYRTRRGPSGGENLARDRLNFSRAATDATRRLAATLALIRLWFANVLATWEGLGGWGRVRESARVRVEVARRGWVRARTRIATIRLISPDASKRAVRVGEKFRVATTQGLVSARDGLVGVSGAVALRVRAVATAVQAVAALLLTAVAVVVRRATQAAAAALKQNVHTPGRVQPEHEYSGGGDDGDERDGDVHAVARDCLLYTSPSPRDGLLSRMPSSA